MSEIENYLKTQYYVGIAKREFPLHLPELVDKARIEIEGNLIDGTINQASYLRLLNNRLKEINEAVFTLELHEEYDSIIDGIKYDLRPLKELINHHRDDYEDTSSSESNSSIFKTEEAELLFWFLLKQWDYKADAKTAFIYNFFNDEDKSHSDLPPLFKNKLTFNKTDFFNFCKSHKDISLKGAKIQFDRATTVSNYKELKTLYDRYMLLK